MSFAAMMLIALILDACFGWPRWIFNHIGHPVTWLGAVISFLERCWNTGNETQRRAAGVRIVIALVVVAAVPMTAVQMLLPDGNWGMLLGGLYAWPFVAARSMYQHVNDVAQPLGRNDLDGARHAVSMIVGRDPNLLDGAGVARASIESLAENTSDGIVAPLFWGCVAGLPGIAIYKAINTMDSMIGHRNAHYLDFGRAAARLDDLVNLLPARLTGVIFALVSGHPGRALATMRRDAPQHRSPNAGWPEAAMAAALEVRLSGPRQYGEEVADEPWLNGEARDPRDADIREGLAVFLRAMFVCAGLLTLVASI